MFDLNALSVPTTTVEIPQNTVQRSAGRTYRPSPFDVWLTGGPTGDAGYELDIPKNSKENPTAAADARKSITTELNRAVQHYNTKTEAGQRKPLGYRTDVAPGKLFVRIVPKSGGSATNGTPVPSGNETAHPSIRNSK